MDTMKNWHLFLPQKRKKLLRKEEEWKQLIRQSPPSRRQVSQGKGKKYKHYTPELRAKIARYAVENADARTVDFFKKTKDLLLNESTVRTMRNAYIKATPSHSRHLSHVHSTV